MLKKRRRKKKNLMGTSQMSLQSKNSGIPVIVGAFGPNQDLKNHAPHVYPISRLCISSVS